MSHREHSAVRVLQDDELDAVNGIIIIGGTAASCS